MWSVFGRKSQKEKGEESQRKVDELKKKLFKDIDNSTKKTQKVNDTLESYTKREDITLNIYLATGGDRRTK